MYLSVVTLVAAVLQNILTSGLIFGWPALVIVLQDYGAYNSLCPTSAVCGAQSEQLNLIFTISTVAFSVSYFVSGLIHDSAGPKVTSIIGSLLLAAGLGTLSAAIWAGIDALLFVGFVFLGLAGPAIQIPTYGFANLFPQHKSTILALMTSGLNLSGYVFVMWKALVLANGYRLEHVILGYEVAPVISLIIALLFWPHCAIEVGGSITGSLCHPKVTYPSTAALDAKLLADFADNVSVRSSASEDAKILAPPHRYDYRHLPLRKQMMTAEYLLLALFTAFQILRAQFLLGTGHLQYMQMGATNTLWADLLAYIAPVTVVAVPFAGWLLDRKGFAVGIVICLMFAILQLACNMIPVLPLQPVADVFWLFAQVLTFAGLSTFLIPRYGIAHYGRLIGPVMLFSGAVSALQTPLLLLVQNRLNNNFLPVNIGFVVVFLLLFSFPWIVHRRRLPDVTVVPAQH